MPDLMSSSRSLVKMPVSLSLRVLRMNSTSSPFSYFINNCLIYGNTIITRPPTSHHAWSAAAPPQSHGSKCYASEFQYRQLCFKWHQGRSSWKVAWGHAHDGDFWIRRCLSYGWSTWDDEAFLVGNHYSVKIVFLPEWLEMYLRTFKLCYMQYLYTRLKRQISFIYIKPSTCIDNGKRKDHWQFYFFSMDPNVVNSDSFSSDCLRALFLRDLK